MQIKVKVTDKVIILKNINIGNGNVNTIECEFDLCNIFEGLIPIAIFTKANGTSYKVNIIDNKCLVPPEVMQSEGLVGLGVYGFELDGENLVKRYSPVPAYFPVKEGSYKEGDESVDASPNSFEYYLNQCRQYAGAGTNVEMEALTNMELENLINNNGGI